MWWWTCRGTSNLTSWKVDIVLKLSSKWCTRWLNVFLLCRSCRGRHVSLIVRFPSHGRQGEDFEIWSHTNESIASVRRQVMSRFFVYFWNMKDSNTCGVFVNIAKLLLVCLLQQVEELFTDSQAWSVCQWRDPLSFWWQETNFTSAIERQDSKC